MKYFFFLSDIRWITLIGSTLSPVGSTSQNHPFQKPSLYIALTFETIVG